MDMFSSYMEVKKELSVAFFIRNHLFYRWVALMLIGLPDISKKLCMNS